MTSDSLCSTLLSLQKAIWVPRTYLMLKPPDLVSEGRPKTPPYHPESTTEEPLDSAWNPSSSIPCPCEASHLCTCHANVSQRPILPDPKPGASLTTSSTPCRLSKSLFLQANGCLIAGCRKRGLIFASGVLQSRYGITAHTRTLVAFWF